jgi:hypothetical protein
MVVTIVSMAVIGAVGLTLLGLALMGSRQS